MLSSLQSDARSASVGVSVNLSLFATNLAPSTQGAPSYDVLLQPSEPITTAAASATTSSSEKRREEYQQESAAVDVADGPELTGLSAADLSPLQPFELDAEEDNCAGASPEEVCQVAERLKDRGNTLFKLGDTDAAAEVFARVLRTLEPTPVAGERGAWAWGGRRCHLRKYVGVCCFRYFEIKSPLVYTFLRCEATNICLQKSWDGTDQRVSFAGVCPLRTAHIARTAERGHRCVCGALGSAYCLPMVQPRHAKRLTPAEVLLYLNPQ